MRKRTSTEQSYEPLVTPESWKGDELRFSVRLTQILDGLFARLRAMRTELSGKLGKTEQAADSAKLGGADADSFALKTDTAPNAEKLGGKPPEYYLTPVNLLDNSNLLDPVNQRGYTNDTTVENTYFIDRWSVSGASSFSLGANGMEIKSGFCHQTVSISQIKSGHAYTLACKMNGNILCYNGVAEETIGAWEEGLVTIYYAGQGVTIYLTKAGATYEWVALYEGAYTAETLPPYVPKPYAVELAECKRYFQVAKATYGLIPYYSTTASRSYNVLFEQEMRAKPTILTVAESCVEYNPGLWSNTGATFTIVASTTLNAIVTATGTITADTATNRPFAFIAYTASADL